MGTIKRFFWATASILGLAAATAGPAMAGIGFNHTEMFMGINYTETTNRR